MRSQSCELFAGPSQGLASTALNHGSVVLESLPTPPETVTTPPWNDCVYSPDDGSAEGALVGKPMIPR
ncbi:hypothetical protein, partial [Agromyces sp. CCNWLW203]|uniref:hypothetical protein n=1 Tax=Agromyces sp. CCNWLW203 TaxID=3112842 RepID=UPI002F967BC6